MGICSGPKDPQLSVNSNKYTFEVKLHFSTLYVNLVDDDIWAMFEDNVF